MKKYFYSDGNEKHGPLSLKELKQENIANNTLIWFEGLDDWKPARELEVMKPILELKPPPITTLKKEPVVEKQIDEHRENYASSNTNIITKQGMFSNPFSFGGRIRRTEYGISLIIFAVVASFIDGIIQSSDAPMVGLAFIPMLWFLFAQGSKREHDLGYSGWWQILPFRPLWLFFLKGELGENKYGLNPKG